MNQTQLAQGQTLNPYQFQMLMEKIVKQVEKLSESVREKLKGLAEAFVSGIRKSIKSIGVLLQQAFTVDSLSDLAAGAALYGKELALQLYGLQADLEGFRNAVIRAAAPLAAVFVPVVKEAIRLLSTLASGVGYVLSTLLGGAAGADSFAGSAAAAAGAVSSLKRSLAGFDQITRLSSPGNSGGSSLQESFTAQIPETFTAAAEKLRQLLEPLARIDLTPLTQALGKLRQAIEPIKKTLFSALEWAIEHIFVPLAQWTVEDVLPVFLQTLAEGLQVLQRLIAELQPGFTWLWESFLKPLAQWTGQRIVQALQDVTVSLSQVGDWIESNQTPVDVFMASTKEAGNVLEDLNTQAVVWNRVAGTASVIADVFGTNANRLKVPLRTTADAIGNVSTMVGGLSTSLDGVGTTSSSIWGTIQSVWGGAWGWLKQTLVDPMLFGAKDGVNSIISFINSVIRAVAQAVNMVVDSVNQLSFTVPIWVPVIGGKTFGFDLQPVSAPQIPYLAKGAVLPANKPFMAVVGDQKHGTNVEAPLATIQEALQIVLAGQLGGVMAGFDAVTARQERILEAVLGIDISDQNLAAAVDRYHRNMAVVRGG